MNWKIIICWIISHKVKFEKFNEKKQCDRCHDWFEPTYDFFSPDMRKVSSN